MRRKFEEYIRTRWDGSQPEQLSSLPRHKVPFPCGAAMGLKTTAAVEVIT